MSWIDAAQGAPTLQALRVGKKDLTPEGALDGYDNWLDQPLSPSESSFALGELRRADAKGWKYWDYYQVNKRAIRWDLYDGAPWNEARPFTTNPRQVLAQAEYMSGDMFGVHAALTLNEDYGVAILADGRSGNLNRLKNFYVDRGDPSVAKRVAVIPVLNAQSAYRDSQNLPVDQDFSFAYQTPTEFLGRDLILSIGNATKIVADHFEEAPVNSRKALQEAWLGEGWKEGKPEGAPQGKDNKKTIADYVATKGFDKANKYAFVWFRQSGAKGGAHPELDTSVEATKQLLAQARELSNEDNAKAVIIGDAGHGIGSDEFDINLTEFWKDGDSPFAGGDRRTQLALFAYLVEQGYDIVNIGMRSGALEGPALLGVPTIFMEETANFQAGRMAQWLGKVRGFERLELGHVPTKTGKGELARLMKKQGEALDKEQGDASEGLVTLLEQEGLLHPKYDKTQHKNEFLNAAHQVELEGIAPLARKISALMGWKSRRFPGRIWAQAAPLLSTIFRVEKERRPLREKYLAHKAYMAKGPAEGLSEVDLGKAATRMKRLLNID